MRAIFPLWLFLLALLGGCSSLGDGKEPEPTPLADVNEPVGVERIWSRTPAGSLGTRHRQYRMAFLGDRLFVASAKGEVVAVGMDDGKEIWRTDTDLVLGSATAAGEGLAVVVGRDGEVVALSALDGGERWRSEVGGEVIAPARIASGRVLLRTVDGRLVALAEEDGRLLWSYSAQEPALTLHGDSTPLADDGRVYSGFANGKLAAFDADTGNLLWESRVAVPEGRTELERMVDLDGDLALAGGVLYATTYQGRLGAVSLSDGRLLWSRPLSSFSGVTLSGDLVVTADSEGELIAFDRLSSSEIWRQPALKYRKPVRPASWRGQLVTGDFDGYLHWMSETDGRIVGRLRVGDSSVQDLRIYRDRLFVLLQSGRIAAFRAN